MSQLSIEQLRSMSKEEILAAMGNPAADLNKLTIVDVGDPATSTNGNPYFTLRVQTGLDRVITRNFYGTNLPDGSTRWQNLSPEQAYVFMISGTDLSGQLRLETVDIIPEQVFVDGQPALRNGEPVYVNQRTVICVGSESPEQAARRSGSVPASEAHHEEASTATNGQVAGALA